MLDNIINIDVLYSCYSFFVTVIQCIIIYICYLCYIHFKDNPELPHFLNFFSQELAALHNVIIVAFFMIKWYSGIELCLLVNTSNIMLNSNYSFMVVIVIWTHLVLHLRFTLTFIFYTYIWIVSCCLLHNKADTYILPILILIVLYYFFSYFYLLKLFKYFIITNIL